MSTPGLKCCTCQRAKPPDGLRIGESRLKHYLALPTWPATFDELTMGRVWWTADVERWISEHRPDLNEDDAG